MNPSSERCRKSALIRPDEWSQRPGGGAELQWAVNGMIAMGNDPFKLRHGLAAAACAMLLALASAPAAQAQTQADPDEDTFEQQVIKNIMGGLGVDVGRPGINYRERSPLVIPPTLDLPPPEANNPSAGNPAWPREAERKKAVAAKSQNARATTEDPGTTSALTPDELRRGINPRAPRATDGAQTNATDDVNSGRPSRPGELNQSNIFTWGNLMGTGLQEKATFTGEPKRGSLTQPPPGYQTPSSAQPYQAGTERGGWKIPSLLDRPVGND
jgi:hypothetical protein